MATASILVLQGPTGLSDPTWVHIDPFLPSKKHLLNTYYVLKLDVRCAKKTILILELTG